MNAIQGVLAIRKKTEGTCVEGVSRPARHAIGPFGRRFVTQHHFFGRHPAGPDTLHIYKRLARPRETIATNAHPEA